MSNDLIRIGQPVSVHFFRNSRRTSVYAGQIIQVCADGSVHVVYYRPESGDWREICGVFCGKERGRSVWWESAT